MLFFSIGSAYFVTGSYPPEALVVADVENIADLSQECLSDSYMPPTITTAPTSSSSSSSTKPSHSHSWSESNSRAVIHEDRVGLLGQA